MKRRAWKRKPPASPVGSRPPTTSKSRSCSAYLEKARWGDGFACPHCGTAGEPFHFENRPGVLRCRIADHGDVLVLLKTAEGDGELLGKLYGNMSERSRKMCEEDLDFKFKESFPDADAEMAIGRLSEAANELEKRGT